MLQAYLSTALREEQKERPWLDFLHSYKFS